MDKLTDLKLRGVKTPGKYFDGGGLYLEVTAAGGRYWRLKYRFGGKEKGPGDQRVLAMRLASAVTRVQVRPERRVDEGRCERRQGFGTKVPLS